MAGPIAQIMSRKMSIWFASGLCCVSNIIMMTTTSIGGLYAGRLLIGLANGLFMTFAQLYIQESAPARYRGLMISTFQIWTSVGALIGTIVDNFTAPILDKSSYLIPLGIVYIVPVILSIGIFFIPESPRWLMQHGETEKAKKALIWMRPYGEIQVDEEIKAIESAMNKDAEQNRNTGILDLFSNPVDRRRTILAVCALTVQGASGAMYMIGKYATPFCMQSVPLLSIS